MGANGLGYPNCPGYGSGDIHFTVRVLGENRPTTCFASHTRRYCGFPFNHAQIEGEAGSCSRVEQLEGGANPKPGVLVLSEGSGRATDATAQAFLAHIPFVCCISSILSQ
jgi:hypothetical protein